MGRTGTLFAYQQSGIEPDIIATAKGLGGGFPMGAVIAKKAIGDAMGPGSHGTTFGGSPLAVAAGNAVLDVMDEAGFFDNLGARITQLDDGLHSLQVQFGQKISEVRGAGFLRGLKMDNAYQAADLNAALRDRHLLAVPAADNVLRLLPPLTISQDEVEKILMILHECLETL